MLTVIDTPSVPEAARSAFEQAQRLYAEGLRPVVLASSRTEAERLKERWARAEGAGSFGVAVETLASWTADLWELFGDGRALVTRDARSLLASAALGQARAAGEAAGLASSEGTAAFVAEIAAAALPFAVESRASSRDTLNEGERAVCAALGRYRSLLCERGLVEPCEAMVLLAESGALGTWRALVLGTEPDELSACERRLLEAAQATVLRNARTVPPEVVAAPAAVAVPSRAAELADLLATLYAPDEGHPVQAGGAVRFVLPTGRYAAPAALADAVCDVLAQRPDAHVAVAGRDAFSLFEELAPRLAARGVAARGQGSVPFARTAFGAAWLALLEVLCGEGDRFERAAADFALSPLSGMGVQTAFRLDARWRQNRLVERDEVLTDLACRADEPLNGVIGLLECGEVAEALDVLQAHITRQASWPEGYRALQLAALASARAAHEEAARLGFPLAACLPLLEGRMVRFSLESRADGDSAACDVSAAPGGPAVRICSLADAASLEPGTLETLFICDLSAASYPVRADDGARAHLLAALGAGEPADALGRARRTFYDALSVPTDELVLSRPLNTADADEERPAVVFEDVLDCYRRDLQGGSDTDRATGLPAALAGYARTRSEGAASENLAPNGTPPALSREAPVLPTGYVSQRGKSRVLLPQQHGGVVAPGRVISPSSIESYLECPYKWFAHRRLRLEPIDAGIGNVQFGTFAHRVLERFYARFSLEVAPKVAHETLEKARTLLSAVFDEELAHDAACIGSPSVLVARSDLERAEIEGLRRQLLRYLEREAALLPGFTPLAGERSFGWDAGGFTYAGFQVTGTIDRIDVDGYGRAVVIDYKGSLSGAYDLRRPARGRRGAGGGSAEAPAEPAFALPRKVQALVYAQAVRRTMGLEPVGALYVSYGKKGVVSGAFDHCALDPEKDLLGIRADACGAMGFLDLLDAVEEAVAARLAHLVAGEVPACPLDAEACEYCPVSVCSVRDAQAATAGEGGQ